MSVDEYRLLTFIDGNTTLHQLVRLSPMGEFPTYRAVYRLVGQNLVAVSGSREEKEQTTEDEEELLMSIIFNLFSKAFYEIRCHVDQVVGEENQHFGAFAAQYRRGLTSYFPGVEPGSEAQPSYDKFVYTVRALPVDTRYYQLMRGLENMLTEQLEYVYQLVGEGPYRRAVARTKMLMTEPLAMHRELLKKYHFDENFFQSLRQADKTVKMIRGIA